MDNIKLLARSLDIVYERHKILSNNVANVDTPGYVRHDIKFEKEIEKLINNVEEINNSKNYEIQKYPAQELKIENELTEITKNTLLYSSLSKILVLKLKIIENSLSGGNY